MSTSLAVRHQLLSHLLELTRERSALNEGDVEGFIALLDQREGVIGQLADADRGRLGASPRMDAARAGVDDDADARVAVGLLVAAILREDEENERRLRAEMERIREALLRIGRGHAAARGYASALPERRLGRAFDVVR